MTRRRQNRDLASGRWSGVVLGVGFGALIGALLSIWATLIRVLTGSSAFSDLNTSYPLVVVSYLGSGVVAGALVGILGRFVRGRIGAAILGFVVAIPCGLVFATAMGNPPPWSVEDLLVTLTLAATLGAGVGYQYWRIFTGEL